MILPSAVGRSILVVGAHLLRALSLLTRILLAAVCIGGAPGPMASAQSVRDYGSATQSDPWGPYIREAAERFRMPEKWIRAVILHESGGRSMLDGQPIVSGEGAIGLMQVMPQTYQCLRQRHGLGPDAFDPHDNILAGTAYMHELYDLFDAPGFLGAYNCGPGCYGDYLAGKRRLPAEAGSYIAALSPSLKGAKPGRTGMKEMTAIQGRKVSLVQAELRTGGSNRVRATSDPDDAIRAAPITAATGGCASGKTASLTPLAGPSAPDITITSDRGRSPTIRSGDLVSARVRVSGNAYVHCYYEDGTGAISRIFPNRFQPDAHVPAGRQVEIPPASHPFNIRMDQPGRSESITCLSASADISKRLPNQYWTGDLEPMPEIDMLDILDTYAATSDITVRNATLSIAVVPGP